MWDDLGVGLAVELVACGSEFLAEFAIVFDDPVVNDGDGTVAVGMGMCVLVRGRPVCAPSGVADPGVSPD